MPTRTESIKRFLTASTYPDLVDLYNHDMEVQVLVARDDGERVTGEYKGKHWSAWTDGIQTWKSIRIPYNAATEPTYEDAEINFDLAKHAEGIGMTGWDWKNKVSKWVGFDYDAITGHAESHKKKLTEEEFHELEARIKEIDWVTLRLSTGGKGRHIYVFTPDVETQTHNEHAALARAILSNLSGITGYDFNAKVDVCGAVLWQWHRKMRGTDGLKILKKGTILDRVPTNWQDHVKVTSGKAKRTLPAFIAEEYQETFDELTGQNSAIPLDKSHLRLMDFLRERDVAGWWDSDRRMLVTHTYYLAQAHQELNLKGPFRTISTGSEAPSDFNSFLFPLRNGAWSVRRYNIGAAEDITWTQDNKGYTRCYLNKEPDFDTACRAAGGHLNAKGGYFFTEALLAVDAAKMLGVVLDLAPYALGRQCTFSKGKDDRLVVTVEQDPRDDQSQMKSWYVDKKNWQKVYPISLTPPPSEIEIQNFDDVMRHLIKEYVDYGFVIKNAEGNWIQEKRENVRDVLIAMQQTPREAAVIIGAAVLKPWTIVNRPFQPEYLEGRMWNKDAAQLAFVPNQSDERSFPTWQKILNHVGKNLDSAVQKNYWCQNNDITTGADYLKCWVASLIQQPTEQLPYVFLFSPEQSTGKTIFHEAISLLFTKGADFAKLALTNQGSFNAEIENLVLCIVEEENVSARAQTAYNRIKDWVTAKRIQIHKKGLTPHTITNTTHWIQTANDPSYCPMYPGDKRITMIRVSELDPKEKIPKTQMLELLRKEAPDFLQELLTLELPSLGDRLAVEPIDTEEKEIAQEANMSDLELFVRENCFYVPGHTILLSDLVNRFHKTLQKFEQDQWTTKRIAKMIPPPYEKANHRATNAVHIVNASWDPDARASVKLTVKKIGERKVFLENGQE